MARPKRTHLMVHHWQRSSNTLVGEVRSPACQAALTDQQEGHFCFANTKTFLLGCNMFKPSKPGHLPTMEAPVKGHGSPGPQAFAGQSGMPSADGPCAAFTARAAALRAARRIGTGSTACGRRMRWRRTEWSTHSRGWFVGKAGQSQDWARSMDDRFEPMLTDAA